MRKENLNVNDGNNEVDANEVGKLDTTQKDETKNRTQESRSTKSKESLRSDRLANFFEEYSMGFSLLIDLTNYITSAFDEDVIRSGKEAKKRLVSLGKFIQADDKLVGNFLLTFLDLDSQSARKVLATTVIQDMLEFSHSLRAWRGVLFDLIKAGIFEMPRFKMYLRHIATEIAGGSDKVLPSDWLCSLALGDDIKIFYPAIQIEPPADRECSFNDMGWYYLDDARRDDNPKLLSGLYVIIGRPTAGKSTWLSAAMAHAKKAHGEAYVNAKFLFEAGSPNGESAASFEEIEHTLNTSLWDDSLILGWDSLRFLSAVSRYPAKAGGIPGGLNIYATQLNIACERLQKLSFAVLATDTDSVTDAQTYATMMLGSVAGVFVPSSLNFKNVKNADLEANQNEEEIILVEGRGEVSLRAGTRAFHHFGFAVENGLPVKNPYFKKGGNASKSKKGTHRSALSEGALADALSEAIASLSGDSLEAKE